MKFLKPLLVVIFLLPATVYSQEEFFGTRNGFNFSYAKINMFDINAYGLSFHSKRGLLFGFSASDNIPTFSAGEMFELDKGSDFPAKPFISVSYSWVSDASLIGANGGLYQCFYMNSSFPFSISGSIAIAHAINSRFDYYGTNTDTEIGFAAGYTQSFFNKSVVSPNVGISYSFTSQDMYPMFNFGLNVNIGSINQD